MKRFTSILRGLSLMTLCFVTLGNAAYATVYTAAVSGNFNAGLTWGGVAPPAIVSSDVVIIPSGITVTVTADQVFSGTSSLTVSGALTAATGTTLSFMAGGLSGAGSISADSMVLGLASGFTFTGPIVARKLTSLGANVTSAASFSVRNSLNLASGILNIGAGNLIMGNLSTINRFGGSISATGTGTLSLDSAYSVVYSLTSAVTGPELNGTGVGSIIVNVPGAVTLAANQTINSALTLTAGTLSLVGYTLTFGPAASLSASGTGTITGSILSNVIVNTTAGLTGAMRFATGTGGVLNDFVVNTTTGGATLGSDLNINGLLTLTAGTLSLNGRTLTLNPTGNISASGTGTITGSTLSNLVINTTTGLTGALRFATGTGGVLNNLVVNTTTGGATLGSDININGLLTLTSGALSLNGRTLTLNPTGNISGSGTITGSATSNLVINTTAGLTAPLSFTSGSSMLNNLTLNTGAGGATLSSDLGLSGMLTLTAGTLSLNGRTLTLNSTGNVAATGTGTITGSTLSNVIINAATGLTGAIRFATGAGGVLNNFTVNTISGGATLGSDLNINGLLTLTAGTLSLNGRTLTLNTAGNISASGTGTITGSTLSNLVVNTTSGLTGALRFATGAGGVLNNLVVNTTSGGAALGSDLSINGMLTLTSGTLSLNGRRLTLNPTGNISGAGTITGSALSDLVINTTGGLTAPLSFTTGSSMLNDLTLNTGTGGATLSSDLGISGMLTLSAGTLSLNGHTLTINSTGNVAATGTGTITGSVLSDVIVNAAGGLTGAMRFATGTGGTLNNLVINTASGGATLGSDLNISGMLTLTAGTLSLNGSTLTINPSGNVSASGTGTITGSTASDLVINTTAGLTGALRFTTGSGAVVNNLILNTTSGGATLGSNLAIDNLLALTSGTLSLNGHTLTLNSGADISGTGTFTGSSSSNIIVNAAAGLTGALQFATGSNMLNNLTVNMGSGNITLGSDLSVIGTLALNAGKIKLGANDLLIATGGIVTGGTAASYVITDGAGSLTMALATGTTDTFKVGSVTSFAPMAVTANGSATTGDVSARVADGVLSGGTTGSLLSATAPLVNVTWFISSTAASINYNMLAMWSAAMEVNSFNRANAYLSHYTGGMWDVHVPSASGMVGGLYTMARTGITSLSPFMVRDASTVSVPAVAAGQKISIYPNPASNMLNYTTNTTITGIEIYNLMGQVVTTASGVQQSVSVANLPAGTYYIHFHGTDLNSVQKFIKE